MLGNDVRLPLYSPPPRSHLPCKRGRRSRHFLVLISVSILRFFFFFVSAPAVFPPVTPFERCSPFFRVGPANLPFLFGSCSTSIFPTVDPGRFLCRDRLMPPLFGVHALGAPRGTPASRGVTGVSHEFLLRSGVSPPFPGFRCPSAQSGCGSFPHYPAVNFFSPGFLCFVFGPLPYTSRNITCVFFLYPDPLDVPAPLDLSFTLVYLVFPLPYGF